MKQYITIILVLFIGLCLQCVDSSLNIKEELKKVVIMGYLESGQPISHLQIVSQIKATQLEPGDDTVSQPINNADASISLGSETFTLVPDGNNKGMYINDHVIQKGKTYKLKVKYNGLTATSQTKSPSSIEKLELSDDVIKMDKEKSFRDAMMEIRPGQEYPKIDLTFESDDGEVFYMRITYVDTLNTPIWDSVPNNMMFKTQVTRFRRYKELEINFWYLRYLGRYLVEICSLGREYADFIRIVSGWGDNIKEPNTNIDNGLGIFGITTIDSTYIKVEHE